MKFKKVWLKSDRIFAMKSGSNPHKLDKQSVSVYTKPKKTDTFNWYFSGFKGDTIFNFVITLFSVFLKNKKKTAEFCKILFSFFCFLIKKKQTQMHSTNFATSALTHVPSVPRLNNKYMRL